MFIVPIFLDAFCTEPKDKEPRTTPEDLESYGRCFRREKNESQRSNNSANSGDNLCFHNLKIYSLKIYGCRINPALSQNRNAGDTTEKMEYDHTCPQIQNTYRARRHLLKCNLQHCLMRNKVTGNLCRLSPLCKCLFSLLWKFIVKLVVCDAKVHIKI